MTENIHRFNQNTHRLFGTLLAFLLLPVLNLTAKDTAAKPPQQGLKVWLDSADLNSIEFAVDKSVKYWKNKANKNWNAVKIGSNGAWSIPKVRNGKHSVRFTSKSGYKIENALQGDFGEYAIFIVSQRVKEMASDRSWQRILTNDDKSILFIAGENGKERSIQIDFGLFSNKHNGSLWLGIDPDNRHQSFIGDVFEVLIYNRRFLVDEQIAEIKSYLQKKWAFKEDTTNNWTRVGPLPNKPMRKSNQLPLSDQKNVGKWQKYEPMWDEFLGPDLDTSKWWDHNPNWFGRPPSRFLAENVSVSDGNLKIFMRHEPEIPTENRYRQSYHTFTSGTVTSRQPVLYGYFEVEAKAMKSAGSSSWWFYGTAWEKKTGAQHTKEIDIFELGGGAKKKEYDYNMNLHVFRNGPDRRHWNTGGKWLSPKKFADHYHTFGLEWTPEYIRYYVDGGLVRSVKNTDWHTPLIMIFDSETMGDWLGMPDPKHLPSVFEVKYVRAWKNAETKGEYWHNWNAKNFSEKSPTSVTKYIREYSRLVKSKE